MKIEDGPIYYGPHQAQPLFPERWGAVPEDQDERAEWIRSHAAAEHGARGARPVAAGWRGGPVVTPRQACRSLEMRGERERVVAYRRLEEARDETRAPRPPTPVRPRLSGRQALGLLLRAGRRTGAAA